MKVIVKCIAGSHLFGLNTPLSDMDYKGVYMPEANDIMNMSLNKMNYDGYASSTKTEVGTPSNTLVLFKKSDGNVKGLVGMDEPIATQKYDVGHPSNRGLEDALAQHHREEATRLADYKSDADYDADAVAAGDKITEEVADEDFDTFAESNGIDKDALEDAGFSKEEIELANALKVKDSHYVAGKAIMECVIKKLTGGK